MLPKDRLLVGHKPLEVSSGKSDAEGRDLGPVCHVQLLP